MWPTFQWQRGAIVPDQHTSTCWHDQNGLLMSNLHPVWCRANFSIGHRRAEFRAHNSFRAHENDFIYFKIRKKVSQRHCLIYLSVYQCSCKIQFFMFLWRKRFRKAKVRKACEGHRQNWLSLIMASYITWGLLCKIKNLGPLFQNSTVLWVVTSEHWIKHRALRAWPLCICPC